MEKSTRSTRQSLSKSPYKGHPNGQAVASQKGVFNVLKATWYEVLWNYLMDYWIFFLIAFAVAAIIVIVAIRWSRRKK